MSCNGMKPVPQKISYRPFNPPKRQLPLVRMDYEHEATLSLMTNTLLQKNMEFLFNPRTVAVVGASANRNAVAGFSDLLLRWKQKKPVVGCLLSPPGIWDEEIRKLEDGGGLIHFSTPERAAKSLAALWKYRKSKINVLKSKINVLKSKINVLKRKTV